MGTGAIREIEGGRELAKYLAGDLDLGQRVTLDEMLIMYQKVIGRGVEPAVTPFLDAVTCLGPAFPGATLEVENSVANLPSARRVGLLIAR